MQKEVGVMRRNRFNRSPEEDDSVIKGHCANYTTCDVSLCI